MPHSPLGAAYPVSLPVFEGPLDLLLQLIERNELEISTVSLVAVTDQYLRTIETLEHVEPGALADFLVIASRLVYIKSRALLPQPRQQEDEESEEESADALIQRLLAYRQFKQAAADLRAREEAGLRGYVRVAGHSELERRLDLGDLSSEILYKALKRALERIPADAPLPRVRTYTVTVAEQIDYVRREIARALASADAKPLHFAALLSQQATRLEVVVTFLAVLELIKLQEIVAVQENTFGEIVLRIPTNEVEPIVEEARKRRRRSARADGGNPDSAAAGAAGRLSKEGDQ